MRRSVLKADHPMPVRAYAVAVNQVNEAGNPLVKEDLNNSMYRLPHLWGRPGGAVQTWPYPPSNLPPQAGGGNNQIVLQRHIVLYRRRVAVIGTRSQSANILPIHLR